MPERTEALPATDSATRLAGLDVLEVRFGGAGGQGVILMGVILALAATHDAKVVVQTQSYGPEARGGYSRSDVIISRHRVDYPQLLGVDLLVALSEQAAARYVALLRPGGVFLYDLEMVGTPPPPRVISFAIPFSTLAKEATGRVQTANILTLGAVAGLTGVVTPESLEKAVLSMVPEGTEEINRTALRIGLELRPEDYYVEGPPA